MKKQLSAVIAILLCSTFVLTSCTWKKGQKDEVAKVSETAGTQAPDYRSWATVVEDEGVTTSSGGLETVSLSGASAEVGAVLNSTEEKNCDKLASPTEIQTCKDVVNYKKGTEDNDYASCDKVTRVRNRQICVAQVTKYLLNFGTCEKIRDEAVKKECYDKKQVTETKMVTRATADYKATQERLSQAAKAATPKERVAAACSGLAWANLNYCYGTKVAEEIEKSGDVSLCQIIADAATKNACVQKASAKGNKAILESAIQSKNPALCDQISELRDRDLCKKIVNGWK